MKRAPHEGVVFDGSVWGSRLPNLVEAVFIPTHGHVNVWENGDRNSAFFTRDSFAGAFGVPAERVPVLTYHFGEAESWRAPFALLE